MKREVALYLRVVGSVSAASLGLFAGWTHDGTAMFTGRCLGVKATACQQCRMVASTASTSGKGQTGINP